MTFTEFHKEQLENRISAAWRNFFFLKQELTGHAYSLNDRLRLFHGTVTPTLLYSSETWTLTADLENRIPRTQRQMLRMILHSPRHHSDNARQTTHQITTEQTTFQEHLQTLNDTDDDGSDVVSMPLTPQEPQQDDDSETTDLEPSGFGDALTRLKDG